MERSHGTVNLWIPWKKLVSLAEPPISGLMYLLNYWFFDCYWLELNRKETGHFIWKLLKKWYHFFAAGHVNYPRWGLPYLRRMKAFSDNVHSHFMKGEHTIQLSASPWSRIWSDLGIEVLYNRIGKRVAGIIGQSTNMETVKVWAYCLNAYCEVAECLDAMKDKSSADNMHKEEKKSRISHHQFDRDILGKILKVSIDIFDASQHADVFVNVVTRKINNNDLSFNVDDSIRLGEDQMTNF